MKFEKMLVDTYPGFLSLRDEMHHIVWLNENFRNWIQSYTDVDPIGKTNTELAKLVPQNVADTFLQCHDGSLDLAGDQEKAGLKKVIEFKGEESLTDNSQYFDVLKYKVPHNGKSYIFTIAYDITELYKENQKNLYTSLTDALTDTENRRFFEKNYMMLKGHYAAVLDLDNFKMINDEEGHIVGDQILKEFVGFFKAHFSDITCFIRMGGDEFMMVFEYDLDASSIATKIIELRCEYETIYKRYPYLSFSFGIGKLHGNLAESLAAIDKEMYQDKQREAKKSI